MRNLLLVILLSVLLISCDYYDHRLWVKNSTDGAICLSTHLDTVPSLSSVNPTGYYLNNAVMPGESENLVKPGSTKGWSFFISESANDKLNLFVYNIDSLKKYQSIDTLIKNRLYTRYSFTEKELEKTDWKVVIEN
jgi:hypothetical protein